MKRGTARLLLTTLLVAVAVAGCGTAAPATSDTAASVCSQLATVAPQPGAASVVLVADNTTSRALETFPPAVKEVLQSAQKAGDNLAILAVNGPGAPPPMLRTVPLDPTGGQRSDDAEQARALMLNCVEQWAADPAAVPTTSGSDILGAVNAAARQHPVTMLVISDGVATAGGFNVNEVGFDAPAAALATAAAQSGRLAAELDKVHIVWTDLGETATPLPQAARTGLQTEWTALLTQAHAIVTFDSRTGEALPAPTVATGPADPVTIPRSSQITLTHGVCVRMPDALLFSPDSAVADPHAAQALSSVPRLLADHPDWSITVAGSVADFGPAAGQMRLSVQRAETVSGILQQLGVPGVRIRAVGYGATRPAVPEWKGGTHDLAAAAVNRRVDITAGPDGASTDCRS